MTIKNARILRRGLAIVLFVMGIAFCVAAFLGHEAAYSVAACCFFAAMLSNSHEKKR